MSRRLGGLAVSSGISGACIAYAREDPHKRHPIVWMMGSKFAIPNGSLIDLDRPTPIGWFQETGLKWKNIVTGPYFGCAVSDEGAVFVWSFDGEKSRYVPPKRVHGIEGAEICVSEDRVIILSKKGEVIIIDPISLKVESKLSVPREGYFSFKSIKFVAVSTGRRHIVLLDSKGRVWTAGDNEWGQCARVMSKAQKKIDRFNYYYSQEKEVEKPDYQQTLSLIYSDEGDGAVCAKSGGRHSVIITRSGRLFSFGDDSRIQLGLGDTRSQDAPDYVPHSGMGRLDPQGMAPDTSRMFQQFSPAVKYTFYERHFRNKLSEMKILRDSESQSIDIAILGDNFSVLADKGSGKMICCGENRFGQCGRGFNKQQQTFSSIKLPKNSKPLQVSCGLSHCIASLDDGSVHVWGNNTHGQLGVGSRAPQCPPVILHRSKLRGVLQEDNLTGLGKSQSNESSEYFVYEKVDEKSFVLDSDFKLPIVNPGDPLSESKIKEQIIAALDARRIMPEQEQFKYVPVMVSASYNNSVLVMEKNLD